MNKMIIPAVVIMAAAPVMMQAKTKTVILEPAGNGTCVADMSIELVRQGNVTFNNLDFIEIHYTTTRTTDAEKINVKVGSETYTPSAKLEGSEYVAKFLVKATGLNPEIFVSIEGAGTITVTSATATTGVYNDLDAQYTLLKEKLTGLKAYPETMGVEKVYEAAGIKANIDQLETELDAIKTTLDSKYTAGTDENVAKWFDDELTDLNYTNRDNAIRTAINNKAEAIDAANKAVTRAITDAENKLNTANTFLRSNYADYTNDLARALQEIQKQRSELAKVKTANDLSLENQTSDIDKGTHLASIDKVETALKQISTDIKTATDKKDTKYAELVAQVDAKHTQVTDCPADFATLKATDFSTELQAINDQITAAQYKDAINNLNIDADLQAYNDKVDLFNAAVAKAKEIKEAYEAAVTIINGVPTEIKNAKDYINSRSATGSYNDGVTDGLYYNKPLSLNGKGSELDTYEQKWNATNGSLITELKTLLSGEQALAYDVLGKADYASDVIANKVSIDTQKTTDLAAVAVVKKNADDLMTAFSSTFDEVKTVAESWTQAFNNAKGLMMYEKTGYTDFTHETKSYKDQLDEQKAAITNLVNKVVAAASTDKTIADMLEDVQAIQSSEWIDIATAISNLTETKDARETAFKKDELTKAKDKANDKEVWDVYVKARTNADFVAPTEVHSSVLDNLQETYKELVDQYEKYEGYKNATINPDAYDTQIANFKKVTDGATPFANAVDTYIAALKKAQDAAKKTDAIYNDAKSKVNDAIDKLNKTADIRYHIKYNYLTGWENGTFYGDGPGSVKYDTAKAYKDHRIATLTTALSNLLSNIDSDYAAFTLYDTWDKLPQNSLKSQYEALVEIIDKVDTDIQNAIELQGYANALEVESLKKDKAQEVVDACTSVFADRTKEINTIKEELKSWIDSDDISIWVVDKIQTFTNYTNTFNANKGNLEKKLNDYQTQYNDRNTLVGLIKAANTKVENAWVSSEFDAIEHFMNKLFAIEGVIGKAKNSVGDSWNADTDYTEALTNYQADLQKYAGTASVEDSIDAIVAASKANLTAKTDLEKSAKELTDLLNETITLLEANKIKVKENGKYEIKDYSFAEDEEVAETRKEAVLTSLKKFLKKNGEKDELYYEGSDSEIIDAFGEKTVQGEILAKYTDGQAYDSQKKLADGITKFMDEINDIMVTLDEDYAGIVDNANTKVKNRLVEACNANSEAYGQAIIELQKYQNLPAGKFRDQVMETLTQAVTALTAEKKNAETAKDDFDNNKYTTDDHGYYDKNETAKTIVEGCTEQIGNILSTFTKAVNDLAVDAFDDEITTATEAYNTAKGQVTSDNGWTITTADFADVKKLIDDVQKAFDTTPTALNFGAQVNALNDTAKGYAALIAADKEAYINAQVEAYKQNGQNKIDAAKKTIEGYTHLTDGHKSTITQGFINLKSNYDGMLNTGINDLWSQMALVKSNSEGFFHFRNSELGITTNYDMQVYCNKIVEKALEWDTADWKYKVQRDLNTELAKVSAIYNTLTDNNYEVLSASESEYAQKRSELQSELDGLKSWIDGKTAAINALDTREELGDETTHGTIGGVITDKYNSLTGTNDIVTRFDAADAAYKKWKANQELYAYKASADVQAAVKLAESWIPQNYKVSDTEAYTDIVARVEAVKKAIAEAESAEEVDYYAFGKVTEGATFEGENIPALLVEIDKHNSENTLIADMAAETKTAIKGFEAALAAEKTKQESYEADAKSDFSDVEKALTKVNEDYAAALGNGTLVFADVQKKMKDAVTGLTSDLAALATTAANDNKIIIKTNANEAGWTKVQGEYAAFQTYYEEADSDLKTSCADVKDAYTESFVYYHGLVENTLNTKENTYNAFKASNNKLTANGLAAEESIKDNINTAKMYIQYYLDNAKDAQHKYDQNQAYNRLSEKYAELETYWNTANNTLTNYNTTVQDLFKDEKDAVENEMAEVNGNISVSDYTLNNESTLTQQITDLYTKIDALVALAAERNKGAANTGDVSGDGTTTMKDYSAILNYILGEEFTEEQEKAADVNNDGRVNVADLQGVLNIYNYGKWDRTEPVSNSRHRVAAYINAAADNLEAEINGAQGVAEIALNLDNRQAYTSFQFDVKLPEGMQFDLVSLTERAEGLDVQTGLLEDGTIRVVATSTDATIEAGTGAVARLSIATEGVTDGEIVIDNIVFADQFANAKTFNGFALAADTLTGIAGNASLAHRAVRSIYNAGGQLMDKVQHGFNILVGEDGVAKKVLKK